jgi:UDP-4-amino-4,6-dideoxy-N-acetyl-beta-L-altrosamine N-acetyltransferase
MGINLRKVSENDLLKIMEWRMLPEVTKYMYTDPILTIEDQISWFKKIIDSKESIYWIIQKDHSIDVGLLSLNHIDNHSKQCSWAYYIAENEARGMGLAKTLECNIYDYVFETLNLNKLWCEVFTFNDRVIKLHEIFGSKIEGEFRDHVFKNGEYHNIVRMAILKSEWFESKSRFSYYKMQIE